MRAMFRATLPAFLLLASLHSPFTIAEEAPASARPIGVLMSYAGKVRYWGKPVRGPTQIVEGSFIETEKDANCSVLLGREVVVHIGPESRLEFQAAQIAELKRAQLNFPHGKGRFLVRSLDPKRAQSEQRFDLRVRSRAAVLGVRGTQFVIDSPRDASSGPQNFSTIEGKVAVEALGARKDAEIPPPSEKAVVVEQGRSLALARDTDAAPEGRGSPGAAWKTEVSSLSEERLREVVDSVAPPPRPLLLAGQVGDSLLPREEGATGSTTVRPPGDSAEGSGEGTSRDPFELAPTSPFQLEGGASSAILDFVLPTGVQGDVGVDPVVDAVWTRIGLSLVGEKQQSP